MKRTALIFMLVCCGLGPAAQAPAPPNGASLRVTVHEGTSMAIALSPDKARIAIDLQGGLWVLPAGGGTATRITDEYGDVRQPAWSPDGRMVAFQSYRDGTWRIWTVAADGSNLQAITNGPFDDREPHWSPDGSKIAFSSDRSGNYDIWVLDVATRTTRQLTDHAANNFYPAWSPGGREVAFVSTRPSAPGVYAVTLDGRQRLVTAVAGAVGAPSWSPSGKLLFSVVSSDRPTRLVFDGKTIAAGEDYFPFRAQWISDDEFLYPADGTIKHRSLSRGELVGPRFDATLTVARPSYARKRYSFDSDAPVPVRGIMHPTASPDGSQIAFAALGDLWILSIGGVAKRLTDDPFVDTDAAWSPDGTKLAFASDRAGGMDIWVRDLKTGADRRLTSLPDADMAPAWSPDGNWIAFVSKQAYDQGELYVVSAQGGQPRRMHERVFAAGYPSWTRDGRFVITSALKAYSTRYRELMNYYWAVPVAGGEARLVVPKEHAPVGKRSGDGPVISPDGKHIAYVSNEFLYVMPVGADGQPTGPASQITHELTDSISWAGSERILCIATDRLKLVSIVDGSAREVPFDLTWHRKTPTGRLVVHAGRLIDGVSDQARENVDLVVDKNRIVSIQPHRSDLHTGTVIDATGLSVMPGLIEGHGHTLKQHGDLFGRVHLAYGVTGFRDVGANPYDALEDKEAIESGRRVGPRVFTTGYLLDGSRPYYPMAATAPDATVVDLELDRAQRLGYDMLKTYVRLPDALQKRAVDGAHRIGIPTSSHEIYPAALSGSDSVEHTGATSRRGYSTKQSLTGRAYEDVIGIVSASGMTFTPTLALGAFHAALTRDASIVQDRRWRLLQPPWTIEAVQARQRGPAAQSSTVVAESRRTVLALKKAGVSLIAGVDSPLMPFGTALHFELQELVAAGLTPFEALETATINSARLVGAGADLGTLEVGKLADMVVVEGNPLVSIADTLRVKEVLKNGEVFTMDQLLAVPRTAPAPRRAR